MGKINVGGGSLKINGEVEYTGVLQDNVDKGDTVSMISRRNLSELEQIPAPTQLPTNNAEKAVFSPNGEYLAVACYANRTVVIYKIVDETFTRLYEISIGANTVCWSPDNVHLVMGVANVEDLITVYKRSGDVFTQIASPAVLPSYSVTALSFSPDGNYLVVGLSGAPTTSVTMYSRSGDVFTKVEDAPSLSDGIINDFEWNASGDRLMVGASITSTRPLTYYIHVGDVLVKTTDPPVTGAMSAYTVAFNPDETHMAMGSTAGPNLFIYKKSGDTFTLLDIGGTPSYSYTYGAKYSSDGKYLVTSCRNYSFYIVHAVDGDIYTRLTTIITTPMDDCNGVDISPDDTMIALAHNGAPFLTLLRSVDIQEIYKASNTWDDAKNKLGYTKQAGTIGQTKTVIELFNR